MNNAMVSIVRIMDSFNRFLTSSRFVPKAIGNGPTMITPPAFTFFPFIERSERASRARIIMAVPAKIRINPIEASVCGFIPIEYFVLGLK